jgi:hypothetical protein
MPTKSTPFDGTSLHKIARPERRLEIDGKIDSAWQKNP